MMTTPNARSEEATGSRRSRAMWWGWVVTVAETIVVVCVFFTYMTRLESKRSPQIMPFVHRSLLGQAASRALPFTRFFSFLYCFVLMAVQIPSTVPLRELIKFLSFFTIWSYILLIIYFALAFAVLVLDVPRLHFPVWALFQVLIAVVLFVDVITWAVLYPAARNDAANGNPTYLNSLNNFYSYNQHGTNFLFIGVEWSLNCLPIYLPHSRFLVLYMFLFCVYSWVRHLAGSEFPYFFMDTDGWRCVFVYPLLLLIAMFFWALATALDTLKYHSFASEAVVERRRQSSILDEEENNQSIQADRHI